MKQIVLTKREIELIDDYFHGKIGLGADEEVQKVFGGVIEKAETLMHELEAYDEIGYDLILWFWNKYQAQQPSQPGSDIPQKKSDEQVEVVMLWD